MRNEKSTYVLDSRLRGNDESNRVFSVKSENDESHVIPAKAGIHFLPIVVMALVFVLAADLAHAQNMDESDRATNQEVPVLPLEDNSVIETNVDLGQMDFSEENKTSRPLPVVLEKPSQKSANGDSLEIKEDQIITTNRSLKKIIEENEKLHKESRNLDAELRELRGQRNIDQNRANTISVERDAYKNQNEIMSGMNQQYAQDIETLKQQLKEKEAQIAARPADGQLPSALHEPIGLGTIQVSKEDREKTRDIFALMDQVKLKGLKLKADEAKVHYNMGNTYFKRKEFGRARREFQTALRLRPQDPLAHFNLAFVSGEYFYDYKTAMEHYKEYLELNPAAEDAPLVREKIIEAELFLRAQIPSPLQKEIDKERNRIYKK